MIFVQTPAYMYPIINNIRRRDWITRAFDIGDGDAYDIAEYIYNKQFENITYIAIIDSNIFQFIINSIKKDNPDDIHRDAIAFVAFCQEAHIEIDPTYACYEKAFRSKNGANEAADYLSDFHAINNTSTEELATFALGYNNKIEVNRAIQTNISEVIDKLTRYKVLTDWRSLYLMILKIVHLKYYTTADNATRIVQFAEWCLEKYRFSIAASIFAAILFGKNPIKRMMKFNERDDRQERISAIENMTWDLFMISKFIRKWAEPEEDKENFFVSDDKAFSEVLRVVIALQTSTSFSVLAPHVDSDTIEYLTYIEQLRQRTPKDRKRVYLSEQWNHDYRDGLIRELERQVLF
jgi:hypothetical protein